MILGDILNKDVKLDAMMLKTNEMQTASNKLLEDAIEFNRSQPWSLNKNIFCSIIIVAVILVFLIVIIDCLLRCI